MLWSQVLNVPLVGVTDNFFELGGHSLLATQFIARLEKSTGQRLPLVKLFENPAIKELAVYLDREIGQSGETFKLPELIADEENRYEPFPLTDVQQAYWIGRSGAFELGNVGTHGYFEINVATIDRSRLNSAFNDLIRHHEMLRMVVTPDGNQRILKDPPEYEITYLDLRETDEENKTEVLDKIRYEMSHKVMPADQWPLFEFRVSCIEESSFRVHIILDALVMDGWSSQLLFRDFYMLYINEKHQLPKLDVSFRDYVLMERRIRQSPLYEHSRNYWVKRLETLPPAPELPLAQDPSLVDKPRFKRRRAVLSKQKWEHLRQIANGYGLTPSGFLLAAYSDVLGIWSKNPDFTLNLTLFNRLPVHPQIDEIVGDFTSLTLLEVNRDVTVDFAERARRIQGRLWNDMEHKYFSGVEVLRELARGQKRAAMPVVFTSALWFNDQEADEEANDNDGSDYSVAETSQVWLDHVVREQKGKLVLTWDAVDELFPEGLLDYMFASYCKFLDELATDDEAWRKKQWDFMPQAQLDRRAEVNRTQVPRSPDLMQSLFLALVEERDQHPAVIAPELTLSYKDLYIQSNALAHELRAAGAAPNQLIAVVMEKGWEQVVAVMGILLSGAAYLPIEATQPRQRIHQLLELGEVNIVVTQVTTERSLEWPDNVMVIGVDQNRLNRPQLPTCTQIQKETDLAYVIFTSGSTGIPKGVMIDHRGAVNTLLDINQRFNVTGDDRVLALSALNFDLSVYDVFGILAAGGALVMTRPEEVKEPSTWQAYIRDNKVTIFNSVPALMNLIVDDLESRDEVFHDGFRLALMSGDWIPVSLPDRIRAITKDVVIQSLGGATEASIWSIGYLIEQVDTKWSSIPYGKPLENQTFHILKKDFTPCPDFVPGDLYIGGIGLAKGYWKDEAKTNASFVQHPETGETLYRTGDLGAYHPDGNIEFLGREDFQVKVHGHRIELGEIEATLLQHEMIRESAVIAAGERAGAKHLVAYIVPEDEGNTIPDFNPFEDNTGPLETISDTLERTAFKLKQPGLRSFETTRTRIPLGTHGLEEKLELVYKTCGSQSFRKEVLSADKPGQLLLGLAQIQDENFPLPKYNYPSAGSLYPVQTYVYIRTDGVKDFDGGFYYYHPGSHELVKIHDAPMPNEHCFEAMYNAAFAVLMVGEHNAIKPLYGSISDDFCTIEAGYMAQLLAACAPVHGLETRLAKFHPKHRLRQWLELGDSQVVIGGLLVGVPDPAQSIESEKGVLEAGSATHSGIPLLSTPLEKSHSLGLFERQSYREFDEGVITWEALSSLLTGIQMGESLALESGLNADETMGIYLYVKPHRVEGLDGGFYRYEPASHTIISTHAYFELGSQIYGGANAPIFDAAAFSLFLTAEQQSESRDQHHDRLFKAGWLGQLLMSVSPGLGVGLCPIGSLAFDRLQEPLELSGEHQLIHSFLGGFVTREQTLTWGQSKPKIQQSPEKMLREFLGERLPKYMIPTVFVPLKSMPLTANGKVDRQKLPLPDIAGSVTKDYVAPRTLEEEQLAELWLELLGQKRIGIHDNFFEIGGDSLLAMRMATRLRANLGIEIPVRAIFEVGTIAELADLIKAMAPAEPDQLATEENDDEFMGVI
nr:amino acid adenylation domain-containing protein [Acidobacteriota bacterium]